MFISKKYRSPNFQKKRIPVHFIILHYTAQSLKESLNILLSPNQKVSCHVLIDKKGLVYELVNCMDGNCLKAFHAGKSKFKDINGKTWQQFNDFSLGIELVNWNGNIFHFTTKQYESLFKLLFTLKSIYPNLQNPNNILGHEHIAGFRGKADPGVLFDWKKFFKNVYPNKLPPLRKNLLTKHQIQALQFLKIYKWSDVKAKKISILMEKKLLYFWLKRILFWFVIKL